VFLRLLSFGESNGTRLPGGLSTKVPGRRDTWKTWEGGAVDQHQETSELELELTVIENAYFRAFTAPHPPGWTHAVMMVSYSTVDRRQGTETEVVHSWSDRLCLSIYPSGQWQARCCWQLMHA